MHGPPFLGDLFFQRLALFGIGFGHHGGNAALGPNVRTGAQVGMPRHGDQFAAAFQAAELLVGLKGFQKAALFLATVAQQTQETGPPALFFLLGLDSILGRPIRRRWHLTQVLEFR